MDLAATIADYYCTHISQLPRVKQFHFAHRLAAWNGDPRAQATLAACRSWMVPQPATLPNLRTCLQTLIDTPYTESSLPVAFTKRQPYLQTYAPIHGLELALFRVRHWGAVYGLDGRQALLHSTSKQALIGLANRLLADTEAVRILSTIAVNYLYLLERLQLGPDKLLDATYFYHLGDQPTADNPEELRLLFYLYTHCIINDADFYEAPIPAERLPIYRHMLDRLEGLLNARYDAINLDNKLEFLVCCRLCDVPSPLFAQVHAECAASLNDEGVFIIDRHNQFAHHAARSTFAASEHRNVLYIMSTTPYQPHRTRLPN